MFKRNNRSGIGKLVLSGSLVLALSIPAAGAASAATTSTSANNHAKTYSINWSQLASQYGIDWNSLLQQIQQGFAGSDSGWTNGYGSSNGSGSGSNAGSGYCGSNTGSKAGSGKTNGSGSGSGSTGNSGSTSGSGSSAGAGSSKGSGSNATQSDFAAQVVNLVNQERAKAGLKALKTDSKLTSVALAKAKDMYTNNYFDHNSPTYGSPFDMMRQFGVTYNYAGENIAKGQPNPQAVMNDWMNSSGHRANILNGHYTSIGVAYYNGEWVQEFIG
ncbi:CAP domain-containing protein [Cohnella thermotolerans]|uniref:CAP domain-containing protein n=1 Tax=Cohnella thermotolerans TaxID=329858 RepID=UPI0003FFC842|nr:CAP domain-containing protein [Cohnella thermotolerans]